MPWSVSICWSSFIRYFVPKTAYRAFSASTSVVSLSPAFERILQSFSVWMPSSSMLSRSYCARKRSSQILKMSYPTVSWRVSPNFTAILSTSARETFCTRKLLGSPLARSMLKIRAREPGTRTSFLLSLGTETYRVSPGLASLRSKVMRFTVRSAFIAPRVFSVCIGCKVFCTAMCIDSRNHFLFQLEI